MPEISWSQSRYRCRVRRTSSKKYKELTDKILSLYPNIQKIAINLRKSHFANYNRWSAILNNRKEFLVSKKYEIYNIVDIVGAGDTSVAGLIYGLNNLSNDKVTLEFAVAAYCLMHSIPGDLSLLLVGGTGLGRV